MEVKTKEVREAAELIIGSFEWDETKEGTEYWDEVYNKLIAMSDSRTIVPLVGGYSAEIAPDKQTVKVGCQTFTAAAIRKLRDALNVRASRHQPGVNDRDEIKKAYEGIMSGISWASTPQGSTYWQEVYSNLEGLLKEGSGRAAIQLNDEFTAIVSTDRQTVCVSDGDEEVTVPSSLIHKVADLL